MLIELLIQNKNVFVADDSGGGKTFDAIIAILNRIDRHRLKPQALFVCATHEGAMQVAAKMLALAVYSKITIATVVQNENGMQCI